MKTTTTSIINLLTGEASTTILQFKVKLRQFLFLFLGFVTLDLLEESTLYQKIQEIVPEIYYNSCSHNCTDLVSIKPTDLYIAYSYPSIKFTFSFPDLIPGAPYYTFGFDLKKNIPCRLLLEDKERFTRRPVIWTKDMNLNDPAEFEFSRKDESTVYEFALSIR